MKNKNEWIFETEENEDFDDSVPQDEPPRRPFRFTFSTVVFLLFAFAAVAGYFIVRQTQLTGNATDLEKMLQAHLDAEKEAVLNGDGEAFIALQEDDPAWFSRRLDPENLAFIRSGFQAGAVTRVDEVIVADILFQHEGEALKRVAFYELNGDSVLQIGSSPASYWGALWQADYSWGTMAYFSVDNDYEEEIAAFVGETIEIVCGSGCLENNMPFVLALGKDFARTAAPKTLRVPSPRIFALTEDMEISNLYKAMLRERIEAHLTPAAIRFAVAPLDFNYPPDVPLLDYERAAEAFMEENPDIAVEIVLLPVVPENLAELALDFDGAAVVPTEEMLAAGIVLDLSDYMDTDPTHDWFDYYGQVLVGARWQDRFWWVPQGANMGVIFYDKGLYEAAGLPAPSLNWTWDDLENDTRRLMEVFPEDRDFQWGFGDNRLDILYSYAYNWGLDCTEISTIFCSNPLGPSKLTATLAWYQHMVQEEQVMPDFTSLSEAERKNIFLQIQSARRQIGVWVDRPVNFENQLLLSPVGVARFPGSLDYEGIAPLEVYGSFISRSSKRPLATWRWLNFLSFQQVSILRLIPARPSVAEETRFWISLPPELSEPMRVAFPYAQPINAHDQNLITWEMIDAVLSGEFTPEEAVQQMPQLRWFK